MEIEWCFNVSGCCSQRIVLKDDCPLTAEEIIESLNGEGEHAICTTVQQGGELIWIRPDGQWITLGDVVESQMDAEYTEFEKEE